MRNLDIILEDKKKNDVVLAQAAKTDENLKNELHDLYNAVMAAMEINNASGPSG